MQLLFLAVLPTFADNWKQIDLAGIATIRSPRALEPIVKDGDGKSAPKGLKYWILKDGKALLTVSLLPDRGPANDKQALTDFAKAVVGPGGGRLSSVRWLHKSGFVCLEYTCANPPGVSAKHRAFRFGNWMMDAGVTWKSGDQVDHGRIDRYLSSFVPYLRK